MKKILVMGMLAFALGCGGPAPAAKNVELGDAATADKATKGASTMTPSEPL